jgi:hypothetical protein
MSGYDLAVGRRWGIINSADQHRSRFSSPLRLDHSVAQRSENASSEQRAVHSDSSKLLADLLDPVGVLPAKVTSGSLQSIAQRPT